MFKEMILKTNEELDKATLDLIVNVLKERGYSCETKEVSTVNENILLETHYFGFILLKRSMEKRIESCKDTLNSTKQKDIDFLKKYPNIKKNYEFEIETCTELLKQLEEHEASQKAKKGY